MAGCRAGIELAVMDKNRAGMVGKGKGEMRIYCRSVTDIRDMGQGDDA